MSAATVRAQMQAFLATPGIAGIGRMYNSQPWYASGEQWKLGDNGGHGTVCWPWISDESEERIGFPAETGQKRITYKVRIVVLYQYLIPPQLALGQAEDAWQGPLDDIIEALKTRLRSDPKAGTAPGMAGVIFEQSQAAGDLAVMRDLPVLASRGGKVLCWTGIDTTVVEVITA